MEESKIMFALFRFELFGTELGDEIKNSITDELLLSLFKLSKRHDLAHLLADALDRNKLWPKESKVKKRFLQERNMAVFRYEQLRYEYEQICQTLDDAKIEFMPLKGSILRDYYPEPWMRTSCDIDVLVKEAELEKATLALQEKLGFTLGEKGAHDIHLFAVSGVHLELHFSLVEMDSKWKEGLSSVWENSVELSPYRRGMTNETFYLYHIVHMAVHMRTGGCGIKPLLDMWIIKQKWEVDPVERDRLLENCGLLAFERAASRLAEFWLGQGKTDDVLEDLQTYILYGGVYGTTQNRVAVQQVKKGGKFRYLLSRVFVSYKELAIKYPSLEKNKWLFPFYQVYRWLDLLFHKESRDYTANTIKRTYETTEETVSRLEELFENIGL